MARLFDDASSESLDLNAAVISAPPLTMACWFYSDDDASAQTLMSLGNNGSDGFIRMALGGGDPGDPLIVQARGDAGGTTHRADTTTGYSVNTWHHALATMDGNGSQITSSSIYIDNGSSASDSTVITQPSPNFTNVGVLQRSSKVQYLSGRAEWAAWWDVILDADERAALAAGVIPWKIRPASLVSCVPIWGLHDPEIDFINERTWTLAGTPTRANGAPVLPFSDAGGTVPLIETAAPAARTPALSLLGVG